jgi:hypothetical protein
MNKHNRLVAVTVLLLILPAGIFMAALLLRLLPPLQDLAGQVVAWYAGRLWTLWVLLVGLPLLGLFIGAVALLRTWNEDPHLRLALRHPLSALRAYRSTFFAALVTLFAGIFLVVAGLHVLMN